MLLQQVVCLFGTWQIAYSGILELKTSRQSSLNQLTVLEVKIVSWRSQSHKLLQKQLFQQEGIHIFCPQRLKGLLSLCSPVWPSEAQGRWVRAKSFPLFGLNSVKMSQEAIGFIRCGDTTAAGGVTRKPADRSLNMTHFLWPPIRTSCWVVIAALPPRSIRLQLSFKME